MKHSAVLPFQVTASSEFGLKPGVDLMQEQLFRYAQDIQELMDQQSSLQKHYQLMLQSMGRDVPSQDLLPNLLTECVEMYLLTDAQGVVMYVSAGAALALGLQLGDRRGMHIQELVPALQRVDIDSVIAKYLEAGVGGIEQRRLSVGSPNAPDLVNSYDVLAMQVSKNDRYEICWLLRPAAQDGTDALEIQKLFFSGLKSEAGVIVTDPFGTIYAVNDGFSRITGYSESEVLGKNPSTPGAGRQDASYYQDFWVDLLGVGNGNGELFNRRKNGQIFLEWQSVRRVEDAQGRVVSYVAAIADLSHSESDPKLLTQFAYHDALTGLPNRRKFEFRMAQAITEASRDGEGLCVLFLDLDRFKPINDEMGHHVGDLVLQEIANRLRASVRSGDTVARVGGDEFVVLLQSKAPVQEAESIASGILSALAAPIQAGVHAVTVGASIGCAVYPQDGDDIASLLKHADAAMYGAKRFGMQFSFYETGADAHARPNLGFEIWRALERNEISLVYQPQVRSAEGGRLRGCEALLRWNHSSLGEIPPTTFIPIAEKNGAILSLGNWVLSTACRQLREWQDRGLQNFTMSLNVSLRQLRDPNFAFQVQSAVAASGIPPETLELELSETESLLYQEEDRKHIKALRDLGVKIAIDDFGLAFSSLAKLNSLSINCLKINPQFIQDIAQSSDARAISSCMLAIGVALGIEVIAEGVESAEQMEVLAAQGCHVIQGYFTGRPISADALLKLVQGEDGSLV